MRMWSICRGRVCRPRLQPDRRVVPVFYIPKRFTAGDDLQWSDPAVFGLGGAAVKYRASFIVGGRVVLTVHGTPDAVAGAVRFHAPSRDTAGMLPGSCEWAVVCVNDTGGRRVLRRGRIWIDPDPETALDQRSRAERILDAINATIEGRVTADADSYSIEGRSIARTPIADLLRLRTLYKNEVRAQRNPNASPVSYRRIKF